MTRPQACPDCGSTQLLTHGDLAARGGYGPDLLPGAGTLFTPPKLRAVVCRDCGLLRYFVQRETLERMTTENGWRRS